MLLAPTESLIQESLGLRGLCCPHDRINHAGNKDTQNTTTRRLSYGRFSRGSAPHGS